MISSTLASALKRRGSRKVMVLTINPDGVDPSDMKRPLCTHPGSIVVANATDVTLADPTNGAAIEVAPWLLEWPVVSRKVNFLERRAEYAQTDVNILADSNVSERLENGSQIATYTLDLWSDGCSMKQMYRMMAGRVIDPPVRPRRGSGIILPLIDGDPLLDRPVVGKFTRAEFGDQLPDYVVGQDRTVQIGPVQFRQLAVPLDEEGILFYCFDGPASDPIEQVEKGGVPLPVSEWSSFPITVGALTYTAIQLRTPARNQSNQIMDVVSYSGGAGQQIRGNAIEQLLYLSGYKLTDRAMALSRAISRDFPLSILINDGGSTALSILTDRLLGQTNMILTLSNGAVDLIPIEVGEFTPPPMELGSNLLYRIPLDESETPIDQVYSQIEILCGRDQFGSSGSAKPIKTILRSSSLGDNVIRRILANGKAINGIDRTLSIQANDIIVELDQTFQPLSCVAGERLADLYAKVHGTIHQRHSYKADWVDGLYAERGSRWALTDQDEGLSEKHVFVTEQLFPDATGPVLTFQTEDIE